MFFKRYEELSANLKKSFISKKTITEIAKQFSDLAKSQDQNNQFVFNQIGMARFGEMKCYEKLEDKNKLVRAAISAARFFIKSAEFNYEISRSMRDLWADPLSDGIHCYRTAIDTLRSLEKHNLAVNLLNELGASESRFEYFHYAANVYEEAVKICIQYPIKPRVFIDTLLNCVDNYVKCERYDLALIIIMSAAVKLETDCSHLIELSTLLKKNFNDLSLVKSLLLINGKQFNEAKYVATTQVDGEMQEFLIQYIDLFQNNQIDEIKKLIASLNDKDSFKLTDLQIKIIEENYKILTKCL